MNNQCCVWDFTIWPQELGIDEKEIIEWLENFCKKYSFQLEAGKTDREHYQGRISLMNALRESALRNQFNKWGVHWTRTSCVNIHNDFYVTKEEGRIKGPWKDDDEKIYIPRQIREIEDLLPWQEAVVDKTKQWEPRIVNVIIQEKGGVGKSILVGKLCCEYKTARSIPALTNYKEIMCLVMSMPVSGCYLIDMPRAMDKSKQEEFYSAIESIKDGHVWDNRYKYKERWFDSPNVWVFTNRRPNRLLLSKDRWRLWEIEEGCLKALSL